MKKLILTIIMAALWGGLAWAYDFSAVCSTGQTLYYNITSSTAVSVVSQNSSYPYYTTFPAGNIVIPASVAYNNVEYSVTSIDNDAFDRCTELTSVTIPNSVTRIGNYVFYSCSELTDITISEYVTSIGRNAFYETGWYNNQQDGILYLNNYCLGYKGNEHTGALSIQEGTRIIADYAFYNSRFTSITIPNSVTSIGEDAFYYCSGLTAVYYTGNIEQWCGIYFGNGYGNPLFYAHSLYINNALVTDLVIPNTVTEIKAFAFLYASCITSVTIPNSVARIGYLAFYNCNELTRIDYTGNIEQWCGITFSNNVFSNPLYYAHNLYINNRLVADLIIPNTVTEIKDYAFCGATCLTSLTTHNSVTSIGGSAFYGCSGLTSVTIGDSVSIIGDYAFVECTGLSSIVIPDLVINIGEGAFAYCSGLSFVTIGSSVSTIGNYAFQNCSGLTTVTFPNSVTSIGGGVFKDCNILTTINFNATNCMTMGYYYNNQMDEYISAFSDCPSLTTLNIGSNVTNIPENAFMDCRGLTGDLVIPSSVTSIGDGAFSRCRGLTGTLTIPSSVTSIGDHAFSGCSGLTGELVIPGSVENIGDYAFANCNGLVSITLGYGVINIGNGAFYHCSGLLGELVIPNSVINIGYGTIYSGMDNNGAFSRCSGLTSLVIGDSVTNIGDYAFYGCSGLTDSLTIPNSVESIGNYAFSGCDRLTGSLIIPNSVTSIGYGAFSGCSGLSSATIGTGVTSIGSSAFNGCNGFTSINFNPINFTGTISNYLFETNNAISKITIGENVATIPNNAFQNCISLDSIISTAENPPVIYASTFDSSLSHNIPVIVPCGTVEAYEDADFWYNFRHIQQNPDCENVTSYTITVISANPNRGTVTGGGTYPEGAVIPIEANAFDGFEFVSWDDDNTDNPRYITVTEDAMFIASFDPATNIDKNSVSEISIFPNPTNNILNITSSETISEIEIVNVMGQVVYRTEVNGDNAVCDVEGLTAGVYVVRIHGTDTVSICQRKFIKE